MSAINSSSASTGQATAALSNSLKSVFAATNASEIVSAFKATTAELNNVKQGATLTAQELKNIGTAGKQATTELTAALKTAQAELKALQNAKASPADLEAAKKKVGDLRTELANAGAAYSQLQAAATAAMRRAAADTDGLGNSSKAAANEIYKALNIKSSGALRQEIAQIEAQLKSFQVNSGAPAAELSRVTKAAQAHIASLRGEATVTTPLFGQMAGAIKSIGPAAAVLTGVTVGLASIKEGLEAVIAATMKYEATMKQLEYATGSVTKAREEYGFLQDVSKRLGLELTSASDGFAKLAASTKGTALEGEQTRIIFEGVSAAAATMNLSASETSGAILAISQMMGKGKVSAEEWRQQFAEKIPAAAGVMRQALGMTEREFNAFIESGANSTLFLEKFGPAMVKAFGPAAQQNVNTLNGQINILNNEFNSLLIKIGTGGVGQAAVAIFKDLSGVISDVSKSIDSIDPSTIAAVKETFSQLYGVVKETFFTLLSAVGETVSAFNDLLNGVSGVVQGFLGLDAADQQVGLLTRSIQGISILLGFVADGVKAIEIAFQVAIGVAQSFFSAVALALSKLTFGDLSRELEQFAFDLQDKAQKSFQKASDSAMKFQSSAVAAADSAIAAHEKAGGAIAQAHTDASKQASGAQQQVGVAAGQSAEKTASEHAAAGKDMAATYADASGKAAASQAQVGAAAVQTKETIKLASVEGGKAIVEMAVANKQVIDTVKKLAEESGIALPVVKMNAQQVAMAMGEVAAKSSMAAKEIGERLKDAIDNLKAKDFVVMWDGYIKGLEKAGASTELLNKTTTEFATQAAKLLGGDISSALGKMSDGFNDNIKVLDKLIASMDNLKKQGVDTGVALSQSLDGMLSKAKSPVEIQRLIKYWEDLGKQGLISGQQMSEGLEKARQKLDEVKPGVNSVNEALRVFGQTANDTAANMQVKYEQAFKVLRESGVATFTQLQGALKTMMDAANDTAALDKLRQKFQDLGNQGKLASYDVKQGLADIQNKMDELKPGINSLAEAMKTFGMTTREEAAAMADKYGQAFQVMRDSGQATAAELRQAFTKYAEAAVQANGGVVDGFLQAQAAAQGLTVRVDETGKVIVEAMGKGAQATEAMGMSLERAIDQYGKLGDAAQAAAEKALEAKEKELQMQERLMDAKQKEIDLENRRRGVDRDGFTTDRNGNSLSMEIPTWLSTLNQLKSWGVDESKARDISNQLFDDRGQMRGLAEYRRDPSDTFSSILRRLAEDAIRGSAPLNTGGGGQPNTSGSSSSRTVNVNLRDGSQQVSAQVNQGDEGRFISMLEGSRRVG